jgi:hypothetical protein
MSIINNDDLVRESTRVDEYKQFIINILEEIYKFNSEENEKIIGNKNKEQPYELQIKNILDKNCIEKKTFIYNNSIVIDDNKKISITDSKKYKYNNIVYEYQPNGSQKPPDFSICYFDKGKNKVNNNYKIIKIECKSSKNNKPIWNCSIPDEDTIYIFYDTHKKLVYIFNGDEIISKEKKSEIIKFNDDIKKLCNDFNKTTLSNTNMSFYPRQMINQTKTMDKIIIDRDKTFNNVKTRLLN